MKKIISCILIGAIFFCFGGCVGKKDYVHDAVQIFEEEAIPEDDLIKEESKEENSKENVEIAFKEVGYDLTKAVLPIWSSKKIYNENIAFVGKDDVAKLIYEPTKIVSVYNYYYDTEYKENVDFIVEGNYIKLTDNSLMPFWEQYYFSESPNQTVIECEKGYITYSETLSHQYQLCVTYEHNGGWSGIVPEMSSNLKQTRQKLIEGENINVAILGDSISVGWGSSLLCKNNKLADVYESISNPTPYYADIVKEYLQNKFRDGYEQTNNNIVFENKAEVGIGVAKATEHIASLENIPDLAIIAYGMNDSTTSVENYKKGIEKALNELYEKNSNCEIILVSTMLPNPDAIGWTGEIINFEKELNKIAGEYNCAVAPMTSITSYLYNNAEKRGVDLLSNSINHPSDFLHTVYAQTILTVLLGEYS